jgi:hypothetical protein
MALGIPVAQQVRDSQRRLRRNLRAGVVTDVINAQQSLKTRLGLVDQPTDEVRVALDPATGKPFRRSRRGAVRNSTLLDTNLNEDETV